MKWEKEKFTITTDKAALDMAMIHGFLTRSYWAQGISLALVKKSIRHSLCFGMFYEGAQIGFGRAITDRASYAYLSDVFVIEEFRGQGLGKWLISCMLAHPDLRGLRRCMLATLDAHGLYKAFGFTALQNPERFMEIHNPAVYQSLQQ